MLRRRRKMKPGDTSRPATTTPWPVMLVLRLTFANRESCNCGASTVPSHSQPLAPLWRQNTAATVHADAGSMNLWSPTSGALSRRRSRRGIRDPNRAAQQADAANEVRDGERPARPSQLIRSVRQTPVERRLRAWSSNGTRARLQPTSASTGSPSTRPAQSSAILSRPPTSIPSTHCKSSGSSPSERPLQGISLW